MSNRYTAQWRFEKLSNGNYIIKNRDSGLVLDIYNNSQEDGAKVIQHHQTNTLNQQFKVLQNGKFAIINEQTHLALTAPYNDVNNAKVRVEKYTGNSDQQWTVSNMARSEVTVRTLSGKYLTGNNKEIVIYSSPKYKHIRYETISE